MSPPDSTLSNMVTIFYIIHHITLEVFTFLLPSPLRAFSNDLIFKGIGPFLNKNEISERKRRKSSQKLGFYRWQYWKNEMGMDLFLSIPNLIMQLYSLLCLARRKAVQDFRRVANCVRLSGQESQHCPETESYRLCSCPLSLP